MVHHSPDATADGAELSPRNAPTGPQCPPELQKLHRRVLASGRWARVRYEALLRAGGHCERCGRQFGRRWRARPTIHHLHYATLGRETLADVEALCQLCHADVHGYVPKEVREKGAAGIPASAASEGTG